MIALELYEIKNLCKDMAELGVATYLKNMAPGSDLISQREAYKQFGEARVKLWRKDGLISPHRTGGSPNSTVRYSRAELLAIDKSESLNKIINR